MPKRKTVVKRLTSGDLVYDAVQIRDYLRNMNQAKKAAQEATQVALNYAQAIREKLTEMGLPVAADVRVDLDKREIRLVGIGEPGTKKSTRSTSAKPPRPGSQTSGPSPKATGRPSTNGKSATGASRKPKRIGKR